MNWNLSESPETICTRVLEILPSVVSAKRFRHIQGVIETSAHLARVWHYSEPVMRLVAALHDFAREMPRPEQLEILNRAQITDPLILENPNLSHSKVGAYLAVNQFGLSPEMAAPIAWHTTGRREMTLADSILYVADQIEPGRSWALSYMLKEAEDSLHQAMLRILKTKMEHTLKKGHTLHPDSQAMLDWLLESHCP